MLSSTPLRFIRDHKDALVLLGVLLQRPVTLLRQEKYVKDPKPMFRPQSSGSCKLEGKSWDSQPESTKYLQVNRVK